MQKDKAGTGALILEFPKKQSVSVVMRRAKREFEEQPIDATFSEAFFDAGEAIEFNARELERLLPIGHPALDCVEQLSMISMYLMGCSLVAADQGL